MSVAVRMSALFIGAGLALTAQELQLPEGPGKAETLKLCKQCHDVARSVSLRQDKAGWNTTMAKMVAFGMKGSQEDFSVVVDYLAKNYPAGEVAPVNINKATALELESGLSMRRSQAALLIAYREKNGQFKNLDDLRKIPNLDVEKIAAKREKIVF